MVLLQPAGFRIWAYRVFIALFLRCLPVGVVYLVLITTATDATGAFTDEAFLLTGRKWKRH